MDDFAATLNAEDRTIKAPARKERIFARQEKRIKKGVKRKKDRGQAVPAATQKRMTADGRKERRECVR